MTGKDEPGPSQRAIEAARAWGYRNFAVATAHSLLGVNRRSHRWPNAAWWPNPEEERSCCQRVKVDDTVKSIGKECLFIHVLSREHVARRFRVTKEDFKKALTVIQVLQALEQ